MTSRQRLSLALLMPVTLALVGLLGALLAQPVPEIPASPVPPQFDSQRVYSDTLALAALPSERVVGSPPNAQTRAWIVQRMAELNLKVETLPFSVTVASERRAGVQVWATSPGASDDVILITAHYDSPPADNPLFVDDGPAVAALVELARLFASEPHQRTFVFMASDSESYGPAWGAQSLVTQFSAHGRIVAALELSAAPASQTTTSQLENVGLHQGYSPLWLRQATLRVTSNGPATEISGALEWLWRAIPYAVSDTGIYLRAGISAIRLSTSSPSLTESAETWLRTLDALNPIPRDSVNTTYWRVSQTHFLNNWATPLLQLLLFAPLFVFTALAYRQSRPRRDELQPEFLAFMALVMVGLDGYAIAYSLVAARFLPRYELFPAAPSDPFLTQPTWWAALIVYGTMLAFGWYTFRRGGWGRFADMLTIPYRDVTLLLLLCALVLATWFVNGFAAVLVLAAPAYAWPWITPRKTLGGKLFNAGLALIGIVPLLASLIWLTEKLSAGPAWWFLPLGAAYGFFPLPSVIGFILLIALCVRFLRAAWR